MTTNTRKQDGEEKAASEPTIIAEQNHAKEKSSAKDGAPASAPVSREDDQKSASGPTIIAEQERHPQKRR
ncbi:hypothetical protein [Diaphorobacter aerolatus]|uniref:Uncharacterized protein n=1 Tax=Diaphorobacter aerolatus TaxID=1288495 RepID=A0A7H0GKX3_9BURK|nr:hypothetical protein [Diaphorobacter aerolatus]QNP48939.1 hypothetical protein H9K75_01710 [Diaphorobacter aerolatus]